MNSILWPRMRHCFVLLAFLTACSGDAVPPAPSAAESVLRNDCNVEECICERNGRALVECAEGFVCEAYPIDPPGSIKTCVPWTTCETCTEQHRQCAAPGADPCGACLPGWRARRGACVADPSCVDGQDNSLRAECDAANRTCLEWDGGASCGGCDPGFQEDATGACGPAPTCDSLQCADSQRDCVEDDDGIRCAGCIAGWLEDEDGTCVQLECGEDTNPDHLAWTCTQLRRECTPTADGTGAFCGLCQPGYGGDPEGFTLCTPLELCRARDDSPDRDRWTVDCESEGRACDPGGGVDDDTCGGCLPGFASRAGSCVPTTANCEDDDPASIAQACADAGRVCVADGPTATCGACSVAQEMACGARPCEAGRCRGCEDGTVDDGMGGCRAPLTCEEVEADGSCEEGCLELGEFGLDAKCARCEAQVGSPNPRRIWVQGLTQCVECPPCDGEGSAGAWPEPSSAGWCVCRTEPGYFFSTAGDVGSFPCDGDGDGWLRESARRAMESADPTIRLNARCTLRHIEAIRYVNEAGDSIVEPVDPPVPLYESDRNDDDRILEVLWDRAGLPSDLLPAGVVDAKALNRFTRVCAHDRADFNDNGIVDVYEGQGMEPAVGFREDQHIFNQNSYFLELYTGHFQPTDGDLGEWVITERSRAARAEGGVGITYADEEIEVGSGDRVEHWRQCARRVDTEWAPGHLGAGLDFAGITDEPEGFLNHHSQFKCLDVGRAIDPDDTRFEFNTCTPTADADPDDNARLPTFDCVAELEPVIGVRWGAVGYQDYAANPRHLGYTFGCVNTCAASLAGELEADPDRPCAAPDQAELATACDDGSFGQLRCLELPCDQGDNDGDGSSDEGFANFADLPACTDGTQVTCCETGLAGLCATGSLSCSADNEPECTPNVEPNTLLEECDGRDNDCDGIVDEQPEWPVGSRCLPDVGGVGECADRVVACVDGELVCVGVGGDGEPRAEICDNIDNDCDGRIDETLFGQPAGEPIDPSIPGADQLVERFGQACAPDGPVPGACFLSTWQCLGGESVCMPAVAPLTEGCDTANGRQGVWVSGDPDPGQCRDCPASLTVANIIDNPDRWGHCRCDGIDNDCDGAIDENGACRRVSDLPSVEVQVGDFDEPAYVDYDDEIEVGLAFQGPGQPAGTGAVVLSSDADSRTVEFDVAMGGVSAFHVDEEQGVGLDAVADNVQTTISNNLLKIQAFEQHANALRQIVDFLEDAGGVFVGIAFAHQVQIDRLESEIERLETELSDLVGACDFHGGARLTQCVAGNLTQADDGTIGSWDCSRATGDHVGGPAWCRVDFDRLSYDIIPTPRVCDGIGTPEYCDGKDNDCDDFTDEADGLQDELLGQGCDDDNTPLFAGASQTVNIGCPQTFVCSGGSVVCSTGDARPHAEECDGEDDDCDGIIDEGFFPCETACGEGVKLCVDGELVGACEVPCDTACGQGWAACNGGDDDGIAEVNVFGPECQPSKGPRDNGVCLADSLACVEDDNGLNRWQSDVGGVLAFVNFEETELTCDGEDNDCDGGTDEGRNLGGCEVFYRPYRGGFSWGRVNAESACLCADGAGRSLDPVLTAPSTLGYLGHQNWKRATEVCAERGWGRLITFDEYVALFNADQAPGHPNFRNRLRQTFYEWLRRIRPRTVMFVGPINRVAVTGHPGCPNGVANLRAGSLDLVDCENRSRNRQVLCVNRCGDGVLADGVGEACDDGNRAPGDGCSPTCEIDGTPPVIQEAWATITADGGLVGVRVVGSDAETDAHAVRVTLRDAANQVIAVDAEQLRFEGAFDNLVNTGIAFDARVAFERLVLGAQVPVRVTIQVIDRYGLESGVVERDLGPPPVVRALEPCDLAGVRDQCEAGTVCGASLGGAFCVPSQPPVINAVTAVLDASEAQLGLRIGGSDLDADAAHVRFQLVLLDNSLTAEAEALNVATSDAQGNFQARFVYQIPGSVNAGAVRAVRVRVVDRLGSRSRSRSADVLPVGALDPLPDGSVCDPGGVLGVCGPRSVCEVADDAVAPGPSLVADGTCVEAEVSVLCAAGIWLDVDGNRAHLEVIYGGGELRAQDPILVELFDADGNGREEQAAAVLVLENIPAPVGVDGYAPPPAAGGPLNWIQPGAGCDPNIGNYHRGLVTIDLQPDWVQSRAGLRLQVVSISNLASPADGALLRFDRRCADCADHPAPRGLDDGDVCFRDTPLFGTCQRPLLCGVTADRFDRCRPAANVGNTLCTDDALIAGPDRRWLPVVADPGGSCGTRGRALITEYAPAEDGVYAFALTGDGDPLLHLRWACESVTETELACNDDAPAGVGGQSQAVVRLTAGETVYVYAGGLDDPEAGTLDIWRIGD